jgi:hypothetical protein
MGIGTKQNLSKTVGGMYDGHHPLDPAVDAAAYGAKKAKAGAGALLGKLRGKPKKLTKAELDQIEKDADDFNLRGGGYWDRAEEELDNEVLSNVKGMVDDTPFHKGMGGKVNDARRAEMEAARAGTSKPVPKDGLTPRGQLEGVRQDIKDLDDEIELLERVSNDVKFARSKGLEHMYGSAGSAIREARREREHLLWLESDMHKGLGEIIDQSKRNAIGR